MTAMSYTIQPVICEEIFDESSQPSITEIHDYAAKIGIDPEAEPQLLPLAEEGLMKPLPPGWKPCFDDARKCYYYHNQLTGRTQWEHPLDNIYRGLVAKARTESQSLSLGEQTEDATYTRDDLPSYEEPPPLIPKPRPDLKLSPLKTRPLLGELSLTKQKSEEKPLSSIFKHKNNISFDDKHLFLDKSSVNGKKSEMTIIGGGNMFLKSNIKKQIELQPIGDSQNRLRGILRGDSGKSDEGDKGDDDDKKSVRFSMEPKTDLYTFSDESENECNFRKDEYGSQNVIDVKLKNNSKPINLKSRFTITPVLESSCLKLTNLKLVRPNPNDFITPKLKDQDKCVPETVSSSNSEDDSSVKQSVDQEAFNQKVDDKVETEKSKIDINKNSGNVRNLKEKFDIKKQEEFQKYKEEIFESHKSDMEKLLTSEKTKYELKIKDELEKLQIEMESRLSGALVERQNSLESKFEQQKLEIEKYHENEFFKWEQEVFEKVEAKKEELKTAHDEKLAEMERELTEKLEKSRDELIISHNAILDQMKQNHTAIIDELQKDYQSEEDIIRKEHQKQIAELKIKVIRDVDSEKAKPSKDPDGERLYEKVRCEKRLLEDKYRCLKDKYLKLKTEVKLSIEKRNRRREQNLTTNTTTTTTGSETEKSPCGKKDRTPAHSPSTHRRNSPKHTRTLHDSVKHKSKLDHKIRQILIHDNQDTSASDRSYLLEDKFNRNDSQREYDSSDLDTNSGRSRKKLFSRIKGSSTTRLNNNLKHKETQRSCSPVENLRKQLQKLEDLEDQFPQNSQSDTYHLRYPFSDGQKFEGSSELEFFRHRIHLERDSINRAKDSLKQQKFNFKQRQNELKLKHGANARHTLQQLYQEEKDLTDMEVSLHRTRSLLGEKVIRLRHLEQSLKRATLASDEQKQEDATLSDLSSHSASSGISSTEFVAVDSPALKGSQFKESSEIIQSLENLNAEIREIWEVLNKQHQASSIARVLPPLPLLYPDLGWPLLAAAGAASVPPSIPTLADRLQSYRQHVALANAQSTMVTHDTQGATTTLVEKTKNLRQWLRQTTVDSNADGTTSQTTL